MSEVEEDRGQYDTVSPVFWASGAALFIRRKDYLETGGLDGRFFAHMEEIDLCWRLRARGRGLVCIPRSVVYHVGAATLKREDSRKTFLNFRNNLLMLYKNLPEAELVPVMRMRTLLDYVAALNFLLHFQWANARAVLRARRAYRALKASYAAVRAENRRCAVTDDIPNGCASVWFGRSTGGGKRGFRKWIEGYGALVAPPIFCTTLFQRIQI